MILYTIGYNSWTFRDFTQKVKDLSAMVIDVRFLPASYSPFWKKNHLDKSLGNNYIHLPELGNKNFNSPEKQIEIVDIESGTKKVIGYMELGINCILLCACEDVEKCHRKIISRYIQEKIGCELFNL